AVFHLDRLMALWPDARPGLLRQRTHVLATALGQKLDYGLARSLARQVVADPDTVPHKETLLLILSRLPESPLDRLHGALRFPTGKARAAALVSRAILQNRARPEPPVDELLLCHALLAQKRTGEAREYLAKAAAWMDAGIASQRFAAVLAGGSNGPLAAL